MHREGVTSVKPYLQVCQTHTINCLSAISSTWTQKPAVCFEFVGHKYLKLKSAAARNGRRLVGLAGSYACFCDAVPSW